MSGTGIDTATGRSNPTNTQPETPHPAGTSLGSDFEAAQQEIAQQEAGGGAATQVGSDRGAATSEGQQAGGTEAQQSTGSQSTPPETSGGTGGASDTGEASNTRQRADRPPAFDLGLPPGTVPGLRRSYEATLAESSRGPQRRLPAFNPEAGAGSSFLRPPGRRRGPSLESQDSRRGTPSINEPLPGNTPPLSTTSQDRNQLAQTPTPSDGRPPQAQWSSDTPVVQNSASRHFGNIPEGQRLEFQGNQSYAQIGRNDGAMTTGENVGTTRLESNNASFRADGNQARMDGRAPGHVIVGTNHGHASFSRNAGNVTAGSNDGIYRSVDAAPSAIENIASHNHEMQIVNSQAKTHIDSSSSDIQLGEPARDGSAARPGLTGDGTLTISSFKNGKVNHVVNDSPLRVVGNGVTAFFKSGSVRGSGPRVHDEVHKSDNGKPLELNEYGRPGFFSPAATFKAGEALKTYVANPYNAVGAFGIYFANATGAVAAPINTHNSLHPGLSTSAAPAVTSTAAKATGFLKK